MEEYTIHRLDIDNFDCLIPLMQDCFGMEVDIAYFKWKYIENPDGFVRGYYATSEKNEIAAYYGVIPQSINFFGESKLIFQSCDTMTHSKHRRKGLFQRLAKHCFNELSQENKLFIIGFGGSESTPGFIKFGWEHLFDCKNYFYPNLFSIFYKKKDTIQRLELNQIEKLQNLIANKSNTTIQTNKTFEKFCWRFNNPLRNYKVKTFCSNSGEIKSFIIYYIEHNKIQLMDYYFYTTSEGKSLINQALKLESKQQKIQGVLAFCQENASWSKELRKIGFFTNPFSKGPLSYKTPFITFTNKEVLSKISDNKKWNISPFDHDSL